MLAGGCKKGDVRVSFWKRFPAFSELWNIFSCVSTGSGRLCELLKFIHLIHLGGPVQLKSSILPCRCESSSSRLGVQRAASSCESSPHNGISHRAMEKRPLTSAMGMLRGYYGLASMSRADGEGTEMATYKSDNEAHSEDEPFSPILQPRDEGRRYSTGDRRDVSFGYARESCDNLLDTCWSLQTPNNLGTDSSLLMRSSRDPFGRVGEIETLSEVETWPKERPIRRRAKGEFGSDELLSVGERVAFPSRSPAPRPRDASTLPSTRLVTSIPLNGWHSSSEGPVAATGMKTLGAALLGSKGTMGGLISKVRRSGSATSLNEIGKTMPASASPGMSPAPLGTSSVLEGLTTVIRRAKAALD